MSNPEMAGLLQAAPNAPVMLTAGGPRPLGPAVHVPTRRPSQVVSERCMEPTAFGATGVPSGATPSWFSSYGDKQQIMSTRMVKMSFMCLTVVMCCVVFAGIMLHTLAKKTVEDDDSSTLDTIPLPNTAVTIATTRTASSATKTTVAVTSTTPGPKVVFCTVSETLLAEDPITNNMCDYAVFAELEVSDNGFVPSNGQSAWDIYRSAVSQATKTVGGVSFSAQNHAQAGSTLRQLEARLDDVKALAKEKILAMGTLNFLGQHWLTTDSFEHVFQQLQIAQEGTAGAVTFLGVWIHTSASAKSFVEAIAKMRTIDMIIVQTHVTPHGADECIAHLISQIEVDGLVPSYKLADEVLQRIQTLKTPKPRLLLSSTLGVMAYVGEATGADVNMEQRYCKLSYLADMDTVCTSTAGALNVSYAAVERAEFTTYRHQDTSYFMTFESTRSLSAKITAYKSKVGGWAFFDIQRDIYWPCDQGTSYERLDRAASLVKP